jgi:hypothetical protein
MVSRDLDDDGAESSEWLAHQRRSESTVVLSDSSDDESALLDQPTGETLTHPPRETWRRRGA